MIPSKLATIKNPNGRTIHYSDSIVFFCIADFQWVPPTSSLQYNNNCFLSVPGNVARGLTTDWACKIGAMNEVNILDTDRKKLLLYLLPKYIKKLPKRN